MSPLRGERFRFILKNYMFCAIIISRKAVDIVDSKASAKNDRLLIFIFSVIGVAISVISFLLFYSTNNALITVGICVIDVIFSYFNARLFFKSKDWDGARQILIPIMMIVYWVIFLGIVCIGNAILFEGAFFNRLLLYPVFLMPAFVFEILLFGLILMGL